MDNITMQKNRITRTQFFLFYSRKIFALSGVNFSKFFSGKDVFLGKFLYGFQLFSWEFLIF